MLVLMLHSMVAGLQEFTNVFSHFMEADIDMNVIIIHLLGVPVCLNHMALMVILISVITCKHYTVTLIK